MTIKVLGKQKNSKTCIICGLDNDSGVKAPFYNMEDGSAASLFSFKPFHQSYPERTHGGMITCMLDELIGRALWVKSPDIYGVTATISVKFRKPVPYDVPLKGRGYILNERSRLFTAKGEIYDMDNNVLAEAEATYVKMPPSMVVSDNVHIDEEMCYLIPDDVTEIDFPEIKK